MITRFIFALIAYIRQCKFIKNIYRVEELPRALSYILNANVRVDWVGRMYCVLHPSQLQHDHNSSMIYEMNSLGMLDNTQFMNYWFRRRLQEINRFILDKSMLDLLVYDFEKLESDNVLLVIAPSLFDKTKRCAKHALYELCAIIACGACAWIYFSWFNNF